jgi:hypothetical protein
LHNLTTIGLAVMKNIYLLLLLTLLAAVVFASPETEAAPASDNYGPNFNGADV